MDGLKDNTSDEEFHDCLEDISDTTTADLINDFENLSTVSEHHNVNCIDNNQRHNGDTQIDPCKEISEHISKTDIEAQSGDNDCEKSAIGNKIESNFTDSALNQNIAHCVSLKPMDRVDKEELLDEGKLETETNDYLKQDLVSDFVHKGESELKTEMPLDNAPAEGNTGDYDIPEPGNQESADRSKFGFTTETSLDKLTADSIHIENADKHNNSKPTNYDNDKGSSDESEDESRLTPSEIEERTSDAKKLKAEGNDAYNKEKFEEAIRLYSEGIEVCPKSSRKDRAILFSNRSACYAKMDRTDDSIQDCTSALSLHPQYLKVYLRRAQLYDKTEKFEEATKDYEKILEIDPSIHSARKALIDMPEKIEARNEKLKQQMMSSLKDLGNLFLRPFGLSTDNFQMQQNPDTGSYNVQFNNNPRS